MNSSMLSRALASRASSPEDQSALVRVSQQNYAGQHQITAARFNELMQEPFMQLVSVKLASSGDSAVAILIVKPVSDD